MTAGRDDEDKGNAGVYEDQGMHSLAFRQNVAHLTKQSRAQSSAHAQICKPELSSLPQPGPAGSADAILNPYSSKRRSGGEPPRPALAHIQTPLSSHPIRRHPLPTGRHYRCQPRQKGPAPSLSRSPNCAIPVLKSSLPRQLFVFCFWWDSIPLD